jgi:hypothetical protein
MQPLTVICTNGVEVAMGISAEIRQQQQHSVQWISQQMATLYWDPTHLSIGEAHKTQTFGRG